jgi:hypothetical protein
MSFQKEPSDTKAPPKIAPIELRNLVGLEVRRRQLKRELLAVECQYRQLELEIELKGIEIPWRST